MVSNTFTALPRTVSAPAVPLNFTENITNLNVYTSSTTNSLSVRVKGFLILMLVQGISTLNYLIT